ncbi:MAG: rhamnan synthesis F family protein [Limnothrix sp.]
MFIPVMEEKQLSDQNMLIIAGMHRSGTSLTASLLQSSGLSIGDKLMGAYKGNPKGHFEDLDFVDFHQAVLDSQGVSPDGWTRQQSIDVPDQYLATANQLITQRTNKTIWGWKDPRTTLFLDFWKKTLPKAKFLLVYRSPWEVADSIFRRATDSTFFNNPALIMDIWQNYNTAILNFYEKHSSDCLLLNIEVVIQDWFSVIEKIQSKLNIELEVIDSQTIFDKNLFNNNQEKDSYRQLLIKKYFSESIELYATLNERADINFERTTLKDSDNITLKNWILQDWLDLQRIKNQSQEIKNQLQEVNKQLEETKSKLHSTNIQLQETTPQLHSTNIQLQEANKQLHTTSEQLQETTSQLHTTNEQLQETESQLRETKNQLQEANKQFHTTSEQWQEAESQLRETKNLLKLSTNAIAAMESSKFWKLRKRWFKVKFFLNSNLPGKNDKAIPTTFDSKYYLQKYPDVQQLDVEPYKHYLLHGHSEGRTVSFNVADVLQEGSKSYNPSLKNILIVCHEASRSGAPILGLELIRSLGDNHNIIVWLGKRGEIISSFIENSNVIIDRFLDKYDSFLTLDYLKKHFPFDVAICNSAMTVPVCEVLYARKIPTLFLVHEYADYLENQVVAAMQFANRVIFPSNDVKESAVRSFIEKCGSFPEHTIVRHQGICTPPKASNQSIITQDEILTRIGLKSKTLSSDSMDRPIIVLGCGSVQIRKGVDYFVQTAQFCQQKTSREIKFVWVGGGYEPNNGLNYSVWIQSQVNSSELKKHVFFFEPVDDLSPFFDLADVFLLSSRLDPFPNVAIDAVKAQVPIVTFEKTTGFAEFIQSHPIVGKVVSYLDLESGADAIIDLSENDHEITHKPKHSKKERYLEACAALDFEKYNNFILKQCEKVIQNQKDIEVESRFIANTGILNKSFFQSSYPRYQWDNIVSEEYLYVANWVRGIKQAKSLPSFNDCVYQESIKDMTHLTPLGEAASFSQTPQTHQMVLVGRESTNIKNRKISEKIALHIHAYYNEKIPSLLERLSLLNNEVDVYITTDSEKKVSQISKCLKSFNFNQENFFLELVPNIGRDIAPFIMTMKDISRNYEIIGHLHLKQTKQLESIVVEQWQNFLFDSLVGKKGEVALEILKKFVDDEKLGLVFPEDACMPLWNSNYDLAVKLAEQLDLTLELPKSLEYPMGNMFWARTKAIAPLFKQEWQWDDFPSEPIPYDGTLLHTLERLTPFICQQQAYIWKTCHIPGLGRYKKNGTDFLY